MRNQLCGWLTAAGLALAFATLSSYAESQTSNLTSQAAQVEHSDGKNLFETTCAACHGLDGAGGLLLWPLLTSLSAAKEHLLLGDRVSGVEAHRLGLVNRAVPAPDVLEEALQLAKRLSALPPQAVRQTRRLLNFHIDRVAALLPQCAHAESECFDTEEHRVLLERLSARVAAKNVRTP